MSGREYAELRADFLHGGPVSYDTFRLICGDHIGSGCYRDVFVFEFDHTKVVKFETRASSFENVMEWKAWERVKDETGPLGRWLAPCRFISPNGAVLIQDRTTPPPEGYKWPEKVPGFMTDLKRGNFGLIKRRLVCHDYGLNLHARTSIVSWDGWKAHHTRHQPPPRRKRLFRQ